jgi:hypothetical protein
MTWQAMQEPPRERSATSFCPATGSPLKGAEILRCALGAGGDTIAVREVNFEASRVGQPL